MKPSQAIDHLAEACLQQLQSRIGWSQVEARGAAVKVWRFMRPETPGALSAAQYHAASKLLALAERTLGESERGKSGDAEKLSAAILVAVEALHRQVPENQSHRSNRHRAHAR